MASKVEQGVTTTRQTEAFIIEAQKGKPGMIRAYTRSGDTRLCFSRLLSGLTDVTACLRRRRRRAEPR